MAKTIFMFTQNYPSIKGDSVFIVSEIPFLCKKFDKVIILSLSKEQKEKLCVPENCTVYFLYSSKKVQSLFKVFCSIYFWKNIKLLYEEYKDLKKSNKFSIYTMFSAIKFYFRAVNICNKLKKILKKEKNPDIFYSFWSDAETLAASLIGKNICVCSRIHRYDLYEESRIYNYQPFKKVIDRRIAGCYFISQQGMKYYLNKFATKTQNHYKLFYLGSFSNKTSYTKLTLTNDPFEIVSISDIISFKRVEMIIEALTVVNNKIKIRWTHIGDGIEFNNIKTLAKEKLGKIDNISFSFLGYIQHEKLMKYLSVHNFHCFITTSQSEGLPVSVMEALSFSIPIIAPNVGGISEIVDDTDGILLPATAKAKDFATAIEKIAKMSPKQYDNLRKEAFSMWNKKFNAKTNYMVFAEELYNLK